MNFIITDMNLITQHFLFYCRISLMCHSFPAISVSAMMQYFFSSRLHTSQPKFIHNLSSTSTNELTRMEFARDKRGQHFRSIEVDVLFPLFILFVT